MNGIQESQKLESVQNVNQPIGTEKERIEMLDKSNVGCFREGGFHQNWNGGGYTDQYGYRNVLIGTNNYIKEHVLIMEHYLERKLEGGEIVHHCNRIRGDNRIDNLELTLRSEHCRLHIKGHTVSENTRVKLRLIRKGTHQKEEHNQWKGSVTRQAIISALGRYKTKKEAAKSLEVCADTLRARMKHYGMIGGRNDGS